MLGEKALYEKLEEYYNILGVDENVDETKLKKAYRMAVKKYHPDETKNDKEAEEKFKELSEAVKVLSDENNRKLYSALKKIYGRSEKKENRSTFYREEIKEQVNRYVFQRRDGSKIEIVPYDKYSVEGEIIYQYRIIQYYRNMTIVDDVFGRINLEELLRNIEYCDFCVNSLLSRDNIYNSQMYYNGYIGHIEAAKKDGKTFFRITDKENIKNSDMSFYVGEIRNKKGTGISIEENDYDIWIEEIGKITVEGKLLTQYFIFSDILYISNIIYSEDIDFNRIKSNPKYSRAIVKKLISGERVKQKIKEGGYIGQCMYNAELDDYSVVFDKEIEKVINTKAKKGER